MALGGSGAGGATFAVHCGHAAGAYDAVLLSTDLEPDDVAAIKALAPRLHGVELLVVVGEGDVSKVEMARQMCASYGIVGSSLTVVQGRTSAESYPAAALAAFAHAPAGSVGTSSTAAAACEDFLKRHAAPLAILLKPPHELLDVPAEILARAVAVAYGSFNFVALRGAMLQDNPSLGAAGAARRQETLLTSFRRLVWVERSLSVGRDAELNRDHALWPAFAADAGLLSVTRAWNKRTLHSFARKIDAMGPKLVTACEAAEETFASLDTTLEDLSKKVAIMSLITQNQLQQMPLADPLVAAILLDDAGALTPFQVPCRVTLGTDGRPAYSPEPGGPVALLLAGTRQPKDIVDATLDVLQTALGVQPP